MQCNYYIPHAGAGGRERERERESVWERERERETGSDVTAIDELIHDADRPQN